jgi:hypothetical protein
MLEGAPDAISASAYGLGSDRVRETLSQLPVNANAGCGPALTDKNPYPATVPGECELSAPCVSTAQIEAELQALVKADKLPPEFPVGYGAGEEPRIAYFVLFPPGVNTCFGTYLQGWGRGGR